MAKDDGNGFSVERLEWYLNFLENFNEAGGFFSRGDGDRIRERHLEECQEFVKSVLDYVSVSRETRILDAGSGPGLPGFLFACLKNTPRLTLNDSSRRRLGLLEQELSRAPFALPFLDFNYSRLEELRGVYSIVTSRALIPFPSVLRLIAHLQKPGGIYAGFFSPQDYTVHESVIRDCGYSLEEIRRFQLNQDSPVREVAFFHKDRVVRNGKPFAWKFIRTEMSQWQKS